MTSSGEENVYEVEKIVEDRVKNGKRQYLIKWVGYPESENTWENEDNILSSNLIKKYQDFKKIKNNKGNRKEGKKKTKTKLNSKTNTKTKTKTLESNLETEIIINKITNEWDLQIKEILCVFKNNNSSIQVIYVNVDGTKGLASVEEIHIKAPLKLFEYYEKNISFTD